MTSTFTPNLGLNLQATGDNPNAWGTVLNTSVFSLIDTAMGSNLLISVAGNTNVIPSSSQALNFSHHLTGALTGNIFYILPATGRFYVIDNATSGAFSITVITSAGGSTGPVIPQGTKSLVYADGVNINLANGVYASGVANSNIPAGTINWAVAGGTSDAITATLPWNPTALTDGMIAFVRVTTPNATTTPTFAPNGLPANTITRFGGAPLAIGNFSASLELILRYNLANTRWEWLNGRAGLTRTVLTSGSGTYTTPAGATRLRVTMCGGGSGGDGGNNGNTGGAGGDTTFGTLTAHGGTISAPGTATGGDVNLTGGYGSPGQYNNATNTNGIGGIGGTNPFGGAGSGVYGSSGTSAAPNTGSGGGGGGVDANGSYLGGGMGGNAGGYLGKVITSPLASYAYTVGVAGANANGGVSGHPSGQGGSGIIIIDEYYF